MFRFTYLLIFGSLLYTSAFCKADPAVKPVIYRCVEKGNAFVITERITDSEIASAFSSMISEARVVKASYTRISENGEAWLIVDERGFRIAWLPNLTLPPTIYTFSTDLKLRESGRPMKGQIVYLGEKLQPAGQGLSCSSELFSVISKMQASLKGREQK